MATQNRSAGRIDDPRWDAFLRWARSQGLSNTDGMRRMIDTVTGYQPADEDPPAPGGHAEGPPPAAAGPLSWGLPRRMRHTTRAGSL